MSLKPGLRANPMRFAALLLPPGKPHRITALLSLPGNLIGL